MKVYIQREVGDLKEGKQSFVEPSELVIRGGKHKGGITLEKLLEENEKFEKELTEVKKMLSEITVALNSY